MQICSNCGHGSDDDAYKCQRCGNGFPGKTKPKEEMTGKTFDLPESAITEHPKPKHRF